MKNLQKGFAPIVSVIGLLLILAIAGSTYLYKIKNIDSVNTNTNSQDKTQTSLSDSVKVTTPSISVSCGNFQKVSEYVSRNILKPDSQSSVVFDSNNAVTSFQWKRKSSEPFISYPFMYRFEYNYGDQVVARSHDNVVSTIKKNSDNLDKNINEDFKGQGLSVDILNTLPLKYFSDSDVYIRALGFRDGNSLYSIILRVDGGLHQAPPTAKVIITCGEPKNQYDKFYDTLNFKSDVSVKNTYDGDYITIANISTDNKTYALLGSNNRIKISEYYNIDGSNIKLVSKDIYPANCENLESQKIGQGMRCFDNNFKERKVNYSSLNTNNSSNSETPHINSINPLSSQLGTTLEIKGNNLAGFEGDVYFFFKRSDGKISRLPGVISKNEDGVTTEEQIAKVVLKEPCQQGQTVYGDYSGIPSMCNYVQLTPGIYKVYTNTWGKNSNEIDFTIIK